jgi:hypothetical protein
VFWKSRADLIDGITPLAVHASSAAIEIGKPVLRSRIELNSTAIAKAILILPLVTAVVLLFATYWPVGVDYFYSFRPAAERWISGQINLYGDNGCGYYAAPWGILLILPTLLLPTAYGQALLNTLTLMALLFTIYAFASGQAQRRSRLVILLLALANLHTFDLLIRGNLDAIPAAGLGVSLLGINAMNPGLLGIGLWLLSIKPVNVLLPILVIVWLTRHWPRRHIAIYLLPVVVTFLLSLPLFGPDWPLRYLQFVNSSPPLTYLQTSLWRGLAFFGLEQWWALAIAAPILIAFAIITVRVAENSTVWPLALATSTNLFITPYALGSHYVLLAPVFVLLVGQRKWLVTLWLFTLTPLLRLARGFEVSWIDIGFPLAVMIASMWICWKMAREHQHEAEYEISDAARQGRW